MGEIATHTTLNGRCVLPLCIAVRDIIDSKTYPRKGGSSGPDGAAPPLGQARCLSAASALAVGIASSIARYVLPRATHVVWSLLSTEVVDGPPAPSPISALCLAHMSFHHGGAMVAVCHPVFAPGIWRRPA